MTTSRKLIEQNKRITWMKSEHLGGDWLVIDYRPWEPNPLA